MVGQVSQCLDLCCCSVWFLGLVVKTWCVCVCPALTSSFLLDVSDVKYVVNFDFPNNTEDYVHRIGRTARAENTGTAYTYFTSDNAKQAKELIEVLKEAKQSVNPRLYEMTQIAKQMQHFKSKSPKLILIRAHTWHWLLFQVMFDIPYRSNEVPIS